MEHYQGATGDVVELIVLLGERAVVVFIRRKYVIAHRSGWPCRWPSESSPESLVFEL